MATKFTKFYQSKDRFLIIVLLGQKNPTQISKLRENLKSLIKNDDGSNYFDNIKILTSDEYIKFLTPSIVYESSLSYDSEAWQYLSQYQKLKYWSYYAFRNEELHKNVLKYWDLSLHYLSSIDTSWVDRYLPQS